jgi:predicted MFS family arabinose efflux permease
LALTTPSTALGTLLGGPVVAAIGGRHTLLASAVLTIALGVLVAAGAHLTTETSGSYDGAKLA